MVENNVQQFKFMSPMNNNFTYITLRIEKRNSYVWYTSGDAIFTWQRKSSPRICFGFTDKIIKTFFKLKTIMWRKKLTTN